MSYNGITPEAYTNRYKKRRKHHSGVFYISIALLAFFLVGFAISFSIRACARHYTSPISHRQKEMSNGQSVTESDKLPHASSLYVMPDSVIRICLPKSLEGIPEIILRKTAYVVSYNKGTKLPNWVAWNLTAEHIDGPFKRLNYFYEDEDVPQPRATLDDYRGNGWSRGHMCPAGDNRWNERAMFDTFSLVNVCPQNANLNSGLWNSIEMDCRSWARRFGDIFVVCGPIFLNREHDTIGDNKIIVPEAFFKVVLCLNGEPKGIGFIVRNNDGNRKRDLYYNSIDQVERITGMDFFPALPDDLEETVEASADINKWN